MAVICLWMLALCGLGLVGVITHNLGVTGYRRVDNWRQVAELFLPGFNLVR